MFLRCSVLADSLLHNVTALGREAETVEAPGDADADYELFLVLHSQKSGAKGGMIQPGTVL